MQLVSQRCLPKLSAHRSGGHAACRRAEASCPADHAYALERSLLVASVAPGGKMHALCGRQDARRYRQLRDALVSQAMNCNAVAQTAQSAVSRDASLQCGASLNLRKTSRLAIAETADWAVCATLDRGGQGCPRSILATYGQAF